MDTPASGAPHAAWQAPAHSETFDIWADLPVSALRKTYESFNEMRLFVHALPNIQGNEFVEVGCATGELYRYLKYFRPRFQYTGFDISDAAICRAKEKYPDGRFFLCGADVSDLGMSSATCRRPAVLFSRDVVHHQPSALDFLAGLVTIPSEAAFLRIRTRDRGPSVLDPHLSCQLTYQKWVPYIVLNIDEVIQTVVKARPVESLHIYKNHQVLGGRYGRFLPKACYEPETGTAETALYIRFSEERKTDTRIVMESLPDARPAYSFLDMVRRRLNSALSVIPL